MTTPDQQADAVARLRKLTGRASRLKLDLHDLAEDLPTGWDQIPDVAARTYEAYAEMAGLEAQLGAGGVS